MSYQTYSYVWFLKKDKQETKKIETLSNKAQRLRQIEAYFIC